MEVTGGKRVTTNLGGQLDNFKDIPLDALLGEAEISPMRSLNIAKNPGFDLHYGSEDLFSLQSAAQGSFCQNLKELADT